MSRRIRSTRLPIPALAIGLVLWTAASAAAQTPVDLERQGFEPVDRKIADVDPLHKSLRHVYPGIGPQGQESMIYRRAESDDDRFYVVTPFMTASYRRSQYLHLINQRGVRLDVMLVPPDTIYHIGLPKRPYNEQVPAPDHPARVNDLLTPDTPGTPPSVAEPTDHDLAVERHRQWLEYKRARVAHRRDVLAALDRTMSPID